LPLFVFNNLKEEYDRQIQISKPGDFSDSDKKCAENFGIDYLDIEDFLNNKGV
jgi:hypothetical protein